MRHIVVGFVLMLPFALAGQAVAFERDHDVHEHGHATLMIVQEKNELQLQFQAPAMNIVGFEHQPSSGDEIKQVQNAKKVLEAAARLVAINSDAKCMLEHVHVSSGLFAEGGHHEDEHDSHAGHHDALEGEVHSEFVAEYHFACDVVEKLKTIEFGLFSEFTSLEEVEAQVVTESVQKMVELSSGQNKLSL